MPIDIDAPWYDELSGDEKSAYLQNAAELVDDLRAAALVFDAVDNKLLFPVRAFAPEVSIDYFVQDTDENPAQRFAHLARHVLDAGGTSYKRRCADGSVQRFAELTFGSGRARYRVVWIDRSNVSDSDDERNT